MTQLLYKSSKMFYFYGQHQHVTNTSAHISVSGMTAWHSPKLKFQNP